MSARERFAGTVTSLLGQRDDLALAFAEISGQFFQEAIRTGPDPVVNVGIPEQLMIGVGAGLASTGVRPILHTFAPLLVSRAYEQIKLDFGHQGFGGVLVSTGTSDDMASLGRTHQASEDVALMLTVPGAVVHVPSTEGEVEDALRGAAADSGLDYVRVTDESNTRSFLPGAQRVRRGRAGPTVVACGPVLDDVVAAVEGAGRDGRLHQSLRRRRSRSLGKAGRRRAGADRRALVRGKRPLARVRGPESGSRRLESHGVPRREFRRYGTAAEHRVAHGLDCAGIRDVVDSLIDSMS